eukprot:848618-Rhodomonas_salina.1
MLETFFVCPSAKPHTVTLTSERTAHSLSTAGDNATNAHRFRALVFSAFSVSSAATSAPRSLCVIFQTRTVWSAAPHVITRFPLSVKLTPATAPAWHAALDLYRDCVDRHGYASSETLPSHHLRGRWLELEARLAVSAQRCMASSRSAKRLAQATPQAAST